MAMKKRKGKRVGNRKAKDEAPKQKPLEVVKTNKEETDDRAMARTALRPTVNNAVTLSKVLARGIWQTPSLPDLVQELGEQCSAVSDGKMGRPEALLTAQAHTLDALFNDLTRLAYSNWNDLNVAERLLRLAFKAQTQGRATVETLGALRNPPVVFARQANIAHGPQQVNNESSRTREIESEENRLLEKTHGERLDTGAAGQAIGADTQLEAVGAIHGTEDA